MKATPTALPEVLLIEPDVFGDPRGYFLETWSRERYSALGITCDFVQDNLSRSSRGVLRGMHMQNPHSQAKLVSVPLGEVFDVAVDVRVGSPRFGKWVGASLSSENKRQLYIPAGFAHGFCVVSDDVLFSYKCSDTYHPETEVGFIWNDPDVGIAWPVAGPSLSKKDAAYSRLADIPQERLTRYAGSSLGATPLLLIGADGMLGRALSELLTREGIAFRPLKYPEIDLTRDDSVTQALAAPVEVVVNCAAWTDVDGAETRETEADGVNGTGVGRLAAACAARGALLLHYSTDYVFSGEASAPYPVDAATGDPVNAYGRSKALGEKLLAASGCRYLLLRTSWLYAPWAKNFVRTIADLAKKRAKTGEHLRVVEDQWGRPTSAEHLARASLALVRRFTGDATVRRTFHVTDGGSCSWFEFAQAIAAQVAPQCQVDPCLATEFPRPARRPRYSVLDIADTEAVMGPMPLWRDNLADVLRRLE